MKNATHFFLGANSGLGFQSLFPRFCEPAPHPSPPPPPPRRTPPPPPPPRAARGRENPP